MSPRRLAAVPTEGPLRDADYIRVSAVMGREDERFLSPDLQRDAIARARAMAGVPATVVAEEVDLDVSGGSMDRPGLNRLLQRARAGEVDRVWVLDLSRWARVADEGLAELKRLTALGVEVMSTAERVELDTPEGYFNATLMLAVHELRRKQIARGWQSVIRHRAERGLWHGPAPLGYRLAKGVGLVEDEVLGPQVREVFRRYAAGEVLARLAGEFNRARGRPSASQSVVKAALSNPVYVGKVRVNGQTFDGRHGALVDEVTWGRVQDRLGRDAGTPSRRLAQAYTLTGMAECAHCDGPLHHHERGRAGLRMECAAWRRGECQGIGTPLAAEVESAARDGLAVVVRDLRADGSRRAERQARRVRAATDAGRLRRELKETREARTRLAVDKARRVVAEHIFLVADRELADAERGLVTALADAADTAAAPKALVAVQAGEWLLERWGVMEPHEKNRGLRQVVAKVRVRRAAFPREPVADRVGVVPL